MSEYKLVPMEPTAEMVEAAQDAYMPFGDMDMAIRMALLEAPDVRGELDAYEALQADYQRLQTECLAMSQVLDESRANDKQAMHYLNQVRELVGGDDFPDMVERCRELIK